MIQTFGFCFARHRYGTWLWTEDCTRAQCQNCGTVRYFDPAEEEIAT